MSLFIQKRGNAVNTDGSAEGVNIPQLMPHDQQPVLGLHQLPKGVSLHPGLHPGSLLLLLGLAAEILDLLPVLQNSLITAPPQSHVHGHAGQLIILTVAVPVHAKADA